MEWERKIVENRKKGIKVNSLDESLLSEDNTLLQLLNVDTIVEGGVNNIQSGLQRFKSKWPALSLSNNKSHFATNALNKTNCDRARKKMKTEVSQETLDSGMILEDSFEFSDDTQTLINKNEASKSKNNVEQETFNKLSRNEVASSKQVNFNFIGVAETLQPTTTCTRSEEDVVFDAFQNFIERKLKPKKQDDNNKENLNHTNVEAKDSQISQYCNVTQVMQQIDNIISYSDQLSTTTIDSLDSKTESKMTSPNKETIEQKALKPTETRWDETLNNSELFKTTEYKKEMEMLFDRLETTICEFGRNPEEESKETNSHGPQNNKLLKSIIEIIKSPSTALTIPNGRIDWNDDTFLTNTVLNLTQNEKFSEIIKKALLENASKTPNMSIIAKEVKPVENFKTLGNFYGLPNKVKDLIKLYKGIDKLYDWQDECLNLPTIKNHKNLIYALPTSGGKTLVAEILILQEILCRNKNVIFVLPYVAIVQEKVWALSPIAVAFDFLVEEFAAGKGMFPPRKRRRKNSVYIATIEKALGIIDSLIEINRLDEIGLVVVDELHLIGDQSRGPTLEALLSKIMYVSDDVQIIGMSATIGNINEISSFLKAEVYNRDFRPVELTEYVKCGDEIAKINWNRNIEESLTFERRIDFSYSESLAKLDPDKITALVMEVVPKDSCLIFCSTKKNCENVAILLCKVMFPKIKEYKKEEKEQLKKALKEESENSLCRVLRVSIQFGVAYHHSGLTAEERRLIEDGFRNGVLSVICCTSTLAAGVNLPAKRVILRQPYIGRDFINLARYKQMVGRAGRAGFGEKGESIIICTKQELPKVRELLKSPMDIALSSMHQLACKGFRQLLLSCICLKIASTRPQLQEIARSTLLAVQQKTLKVDLKTLTDKTISDLFKMGALQLEGGKCPSTTSNIPLLLNTTDSLENFSQGTLSDSSSTSTAKTRITITNKTQLVISKLGLGAIKAGLELSRAHLLCEDLLQAQASLVLLDSLHLLYLVTPYDVADQVRISKPHYYTIYSQLSNNQLRTANILGINEACAVRLLSNQTAKNVPERILNRFYVTLMLHDLWNEVSLHFVADKYQVERGHIQNLMTSAATFASNVVSFCTEMEEFWAFTHLLKGISQRLQHCCRRELIPLMELPAVKQTRAKQLYNAGFKTLQSIAKADPQDLMEKVEYISKKVASQLIAAAKMLLLEKVENLREEAEDVLDGIEQQKHFE